LNILDFLRLQPVLNNLHFVIRHSEARRRKDVSQIFYWLRVKFTFLYFGIKTSLVEILEYFFNMLVVFGHVIWVNEYIIQIYHNTNIQKVRENVVYKLLEGYRSIGKTKRHYRPLKWSVMCLESSLLFITVGNVNQVVIMVKIYLFIYLSFIRWVQQIRDEQEWIAIFFKNTVQDHRSWHRSIVNYFSS